MARRDPRGSGVATGPDPEASGGVRLAADPEVPPDVVKTVISAYYTRGVSAAESARSRAQQGYTIASAIAAALVAAGAFTSFTESPTLVQVLGLLGLATWLMAAFLFIWVVSVPAKTGRDPNWTSDYRFVEGVAQSIETELVILRTRLFLAIGVTVTASLLTVAALASATFDPGGPPAVKARIAVTANQDRLLRSFCGAGIGDVYATVKPDPLDSQFVLLQLPAGECGAAPTTISIRRSSILGEQTVKVYPGF